MDSVISKVIDMALEYAVAPIGRQIKYVFCYKTCIADMNKAVRDLENDRKIVDQSVAEASNNLRQINDKATDWLDEVRETQEEVRSLLTFEEGKAKINACSGQILNPIARHKLGRKATKKILTINDLRGKQPHRDEISCAPPPSGIVNEASSSAAAAEQSGDVFRSSRWEEILEEIMKALRDDSINIIGLHGMGGVGKSTMINEVQHQVRKQGMFDEVAKAYVKANPKLMRIQEEIASPLGLTLESESPNTRADSLRGRLLKVDQEKKKKTRLIILDDLWEKLDLHEVGIPSAGNDNVQIKLLLTSRDQRLLSDKMASQKLVHLNVLNDEDALKMFKFFVGGGVEGVEADKENEIAKRCSGLPIVIEATAKALKNRDLGEWEKTLKLLDNDDVLEKLKLSYEYLPSEESKNLFLICGIIRGPRINVKDLLKYTFGLRLYKRKYMSTITAAAAELEKLLWGLEDASMLLKSDDSRYVNIHDHMRDLAVKIVEKDRREWAYDLTLSDIDSCELPDDQFEVSKLKLVLSYCEEGDSQLQVPESFFKDMKELYVLEFTNLRGALSLPSPTHQLGHLGHLGTLCLHECSLSDISMIAVLKKLQILSFRGSNISKLPLQFRELTVLKMLDLSDCKELKQIEPTLLGSLTKLEELNMENSFKDWEIDEEDDAPSSNNNARLVELKKMSHLSSVRIHIPSTSMLPKDGQLFSSNKLTMYKIILGGDVWKWDDIANRNESRVLMLQFDDSPDVLRQDWVQATLQCSEVLYLSGRLDGKCQSIGELCIKGFECLKDLRVTNCPSIQYIVSSNCGSSRRETTFSKLKIIKVKDCHKLTHLFDFSLLKCLSQIEEIIIKGCKEIQCIVIDEGDKNEDVVTLFKLQKLKLRRSPKFSSFCVHTVPPPSTVLFAGKKVAFPRLESLTIENLDKLEDIWHPTDPPAELGNLRFLRVRKCGKVRRVINSNVLMRLHQNMESLSIVECGLVEELFGVEEEEEEDTIISGISRSDLVLFPRLKKLYLMILRGLKGIYNNNLMMIGRDDRRVLTTIFPNIESLDVSFCPGLRFVLSCSLPASGVGSFGLLKEIYISSCEEMEAIVVMMMEEETPQAATSNAVSYSSLNKLVFIYCPKMKTFCRYYCGKSELVASTNCYDITSTSEQVPVALPYFSQNEIFPCLETLKLHGSDEFEQIWPHEVLDAQRSFYMLKSVEVDSCPKLSAVFPSTLMERLENLECIRVQSCKLMQIIEVVKKNRRPRLLKEAIQDMENQQVHYNPKAIVHGGSNSTEEAAVSAKENNWFPCLSELVLMFLPNLDRFYSSATSCGFNFPFLETLQMWSCPGVKTLFIQRPPAGLVGADDDSDSDGFGALFGYCHSLGNLIPNMKSMELVGLENFTEIWKRQSDERCSGNDRLELGKEDRAFRILKLESLKLERLPKLECSIFIYEKKCPYLVTKLLPPYASVFPSLQKLEVESCDTVKLFNNSESSNHQVQLDSIYTAVEQCLSWSEQATSPLRSLAAIYSNVSVKLKMEESQNDLRRAQKYLHLKFKGCDSSRINFQSLLPVASPLFCNLKGLTLESCDELVYVFTPREAASLVHLTCLVISWCDNIKEVVGEADNENRVGDLPVITFKQLKELKLEYLKNLESFSSVNNNLTLNFPSLEEIAITDCPKMRIFSNGVLTTPKLQLRVDLNTAIQKIYTASLVAEKSSDGSDSE